MKYHLFKLTCECETIYDPESNVDCPNCHKAHMCHKELTLDIDKFLSIIYELNSDNKPDAAMDLIFDVYFNLHDRFDIMNIIVEKIDVKKINLSLMIGFLVQTFKYIKQVPAHSLLCDRVAHRALEIGEPEERIHKLVDKYRTTGNYWEDMKMFGAPEIITGPKPNE